MVVPILIVAFHVLALYAAFVTFALISRNVVIDSLTRDIRRKSGTIESQIDAMNSLHHRIIDLETAANVAAKSLTECFQATNESK